MKITPFADGYLNISGLIADERQSLCQSLRVTSRFTEIVPGMNDVTLQYDTAAMNASEALDLIRAAEARTDEDAKTEPNRVVLSARYGGADGPDLDHVAEALSMSCEDIIAQHVGATYSVDFMGFTPGFSYLTGLPAGLTVRRLAHPKQNVAAGSIGIAAGRCGLYALDGPGGWPIIGRVMTPLFDAEADSPFALDAGLRVTFERVLP